ncbi:acyltransferase family protein [Sulfitobacter sp.]|uniref:acyltransferase family protein n=1 Tax=Sulfitobacter sp. TaxID=1903071 RepID=UPI0030037706
MTEPMESAHIQKPHRGALFRDETAVGRVNAADSARSVGILLVVFGHAWRAADRAGLIAEDLIFRAIHSAIYAFHMPLFFFLAGLLFLEALQKYDMETLLKGRVKRLLWPMVLWSWIFLD